MLTVEGLVAGCGNVVALHESLGKVLRTFQYGTGLGGTYYGNVLRSLVGLHVVVDAFHQRVFRSHDHHVDLLLHTELLDGLEVVGLHGNVLSYVGRTRIARGNEKFLTLAALSNLPSQRMFAPATS